MGQIGAALEEKGGAPIAPSHPDARQAKVVVVALAGHEDVLVTALDGEAAPQPLGQPPTMTLPVCSPGCQLPVVITPLRVPGSWVPALASRETGNKR